MVSWSQLITQAPSYKAHKTENLSTFALSIFPSYLFPNNLPFSWVTPRSIPQDNQHPRSGKAYWGEIWEFIFRKTFNALGSSGLGTSENKGQEVLLVPLHSLLDMCITHCVCIVSMCARERMQETRYATVFVLLEKVNGFTLNHSLFSCFISRLKFQVSFRSLKKVFLCKANPYRIWSCKPHLLCVML